MIQAIKNDIATVKATYQGLGMVASFFTFLQGRATAFAIIFSTVAIIGFFKHYDLSGFTAFVGVIQTLVVGHSLKEDYFEFRNRQAELQSKGDQK